MRTRRAVDLAVSLPGPQSMTSRKPSRASTRVVAAAGLDRVAPGTADEQVTAVSGGDRSFPGPPKTASARARRDEVVAAVSFDAVVAVAREDPVVAGEAAHDVGVRRAVEDVVTGCALEAARIRIWCACARAAYDVDPPATALLSRVARSRARPATSAAACRVYVVDLLGPVPSRTAPDIERVLVVRRAARHVRRSLMKARRPAEGRTAGSARSRRRRHRVRVLPGRSNDQIAHGPPPSRSNAIVFPSGTSSG